VIARLLYLNTHRLSAYAWRHGKLLPEGEFENGEEGLTQFRDYLRLHRQSQFSLLANVAEEGHTLETIPFLKGSDRQALITRKIGQHFLGTPLATAFSLGYEKNRRKNEKLLISALTNPGHFDPWLKRINEAEAPLAGVYSVAQLGGQLLKKLGHADPRCLLLTMQDHSIRESYLVDGQTLFSRMAPISDSSIAGAASSFAAEAGKLHQYLIGQRLIGREENLPVYIIASPPAIPAIEKSCPDRGHLSFSLIDSHTAAGKIGLHTPPADSRSDVLFLHLLATAPPRQQFAGESHRHDYRLSQIRQGLIAAGLVALLGSLLFSAKEAYDTYALRQDSQSMQASEADLNWRYKEISATFPQLGIDNETLRRLTTRHAELAVLQRQPGPAYIQVSQALNSSPAVILEGIDWRIGRAGPAAAGAATIDGNEEITTVRGAIRPEAKATPRQILARFESFLELLRADQTSTITILQQPFDLESERALRGGDSEDASNQPRQFVVEISRKIAP
jgi:hypothetical protein